MSNSFKVKKIYITALHFTSSKVTEGDWKDSIVGRDKPKSIIDTVYGPLSTESGVRTEYHQVWPQN